LQFSTKIPFAPLKGHLFDQENAVMLLGSCFSENMKPYFKRSGFKVRNNPFGILYNPINIAQHIANIANNNSDLAQSIIATHMGYSSLLVHSSFYETSATQLQDKYTNTIGNLNKQFITKPHTFIITLGSAWVYKHLATDTICANCHKIKQGEFVKILLSPQEIITALQNIVTHVFKLNTKHQIIFTVSPVRHIKDGFVENTHSKAILHQGIQTVLKENLSANKISYFPAFELMMDELRDYRFYKKDLLHPNAVAIQYIWEKFVQTYFNQKTQQISQEVNKYYLLKKHKIFSKETSVSQQHYEKINALFQFLKDKYPLIYLKNK